MKKKITHAFFNAVHIVTLASGFMTLSDTAKWIAMAGMLLGRLEIFTLLVLITPTFWRY